MAFAIVHRFDGGTKEQYEKALATVHPADGSLPEGQTHHFAGATDDGWIIVAVFDSEASWERFRDQSLLPGMAQMGDEGFAGPPHQTGFEVHNMQVA
jgi:heme-degrading monooxygenase HmoA